MIPLPVCRWRDESAAPEYVCRSTKFLHPPNAVRAEFCAACPCADHAPAPPLPRALPCVHLVGTTKEAVKVKSVAGRIGLFACALHSRCVPSAGTKVPGQIRSCESCADYLPRDPFGPDSAEMKRRADEFLAAVPEYPADRYHGRGVVIAGGGDKYFASLYVTVRALRHVGCRLPIQVWYLGRHNEMPADKQAILKPWQVECVDADKVRRRHPARMLNGWELKVFATLHSPFDELLFLDADCYPCRNPEFLFEWEAYRAAGAIFWPDMATIDARLKWPAFGVSNPERPGSVESGQYVVHKRLSWKPLNLAWFFNDHSDYYYRYCYGDKHTFEVAWARCRQPFVMFTPKARWREVAYLHPGPEGKTLFVHRCADKFRFERQDYITNQNHAVPVFVASLPVERECWSWLAELARMLGRMPDESSFLGESDERRADVPVAQLPE